MSEHKQIPVEYHEQAPTRLTVRGKMAVGIGAAALAVGAINLVEAGYDHLKDRAAADRAERLAEAESTLTDFTETGTLPDGKVAIRSDYHGTAWDYARTVGDKDALRPLRAELALQSDMQGYSGVEPGEIYIVDQDLITPEAEQRFGVTPEEILEQQ